jgi:hypothetical protein
MSDFFHFIFIDKSAIALKCNFKKSKNEIFNLNRNIDTQKDKYSFAGLAYFFEFLNNIENKYSNFM